MTNCTPTLLDFSPLNSKKIQASFTGGAVTSDGGLLLLREVDKRTGLTKKLSKVLNDCRHRGYIEHSAHHLLKQRVYAIAAGYEDVNDHDALRNEPGFQIAVGREAPLASSSTLCRFENAVDRQSLVEMSKVMVEHFIASHRSPPEELILDFDPTDHTLYGQQEGRHYHGYYKDYCFLPLQVFCGEHLLVSLLRPSNIDGSRYAGAILRLIVKRLRQAWTKVKITFRGDGAFARKRLLYWCENNQVNYIVGMASNKRLEKMAAGLLSHAKEQYETHHTEQRLFTDFSYAAESWNRERRVIAKIEHNDKGGNLRFVITDLKLPAESMYDNGYCPRGNMENGIKQLKLDLHSDRNSCHDFLANQFRLLLSSFAYILLSELRRENLSGTKLARAYCGTLRLKLLKIAGIVLKNTRRIQFLLSSHHPYQDEFISAVASLAPS